MRDHAQRPEVIEDSKPAPLLIDASGAARLLAIGTRKLWELTNRRDIPCVRIGRAVRYDVRDLESWIESHKSKRCDADA